jgi:hypothetical protein
VHAAGSRSGLSHRDGVSAFQAMRVSGLVELDERLQVVAVNGSAQRWLIECNHDQCDRLPDAVYAVVARLRAVETDPLGASPPRIWMRSKNGQWVALHVPRLTSAHAEVIGVIIEPAAPNPSRNPARPGTRAFDTRKPDLCPCRHE